MLKVESALRIHGFHGHGFNQPWMEPLDTKGQLYHDILHKGLGHLWVLVFVGGGGAPQTNPPQIPGTTVSIKPPCKTLLHACVNCWGIVSRSEQNWGML